MIIKQLFVNSNILISIQGLCYALFSLSISNENINVHSLSIPGILVFIVYSVDRILRFDKEADVISHSDRMIFNSKFKQPYSYLIFIGTVYCLTITLLQGIFVTILFLFPFISGAIYSISFLPSRFKIRRLKDISGLKNLIVALSWGVGTGVLPVFLTSQTIKPLGIIASVWISFRMLINTYFGDCVGIQGDAKQGTKTIPVIIGKKNAYLLLQILNIISTIIVFGLIQHIGELPEAHILNFLSAQFIGIAIYFASLPKLPNFGKRFGYFSELEGIILGITAYILFL